MEQFLQSNLEVLIDGGFVYVPLLFDEEIEKNVNEYEKGKIILEDNGQKYVRSLNLVSMVENYHKIYGKEYEKVKKNVLKKYLNKSNLKELNIDSNIKTIIFEVLPNFIKKHDGFERTKLDEYDIVELISKKSKIPSKYYTEADKFLDNDTLMKSLEKLDGSTGKIKPIKNGKTNTTYIKKWFDKALEVLVLSREKEDVKKAIDEKKVYINKHRDYVAVMLYLSQIEKFEIEKFGFVKKSKSYDVYKHTGEYALKDYSSGQIYLFPDCKVGVNTSNIKHPKVINNNYNHPFLSGTSGHALCIVSRGWGSSFSGKNIIDGINAGLNTVMCGYVRASGFHPHSYLSRDKYRGYKVERSHPKIKSGKVEITNDFVK
ncbi:hypothetical protein ACFL1H_03565 [Nanoarchaeota archaeon]